MPIVESLFNRGKNYLAMAVAQQEAQRIVRPNGCADGHIGLSLDYLVVRDHPVLLSTLLCVVQPSSAETVKMFCLR
jgi:hypothetical protein